MSESKRFIPLTATSFDFNFKVKLLTEHATVPKRAEEGSAGYDLSAAYDEKIPARGKKMVKTDLSIAVPKCVYGRVASRSGLSYKNSIEVGAGVIDSSYRGNVGVILYNHSDEVFEVKKGDRIAQLILEIIAIPEVQVVKELDATERGDGGFGSTGITKL